MPLSDFQVKISSLNWILSRTGSQWSFFNIGVMCSNFLVFVRMRAAAFWASCSLQSKRSEIPVKRKFPLSMREVIRAWIMVAAVSVVNIFLILFTFLIWKYTVWQIRLTCSSIHKLLSNIIPRLQALFEAWIVAESTLMSWAWILCCWYLEGILSSHHSVSAYSRTSKTLFLIYMPLHVDELTFHHWDHLNQMVCTVGYRLRKHERIIHVSEQCWQSERNKL